jgi:hypothetical protein
MMRFATIQKELPTRQAPRREVSTSNVYWNNEEIQLRTSSNVSSIRTRTDSLNKDLFIRHYLLSVKPGVNPQRLTPGFVFVAKNMPPRKEVPPVYMEVA